MGGQMALEPDAAMSNSNEMRPNKAIYFNSLHSHRVLGTTLAFLLSTGMGRCRNKFLGSIF